jgi:hypothetical protein
MYFKVSHQTLVETHCGASLPLTHLNTPLMLTVRKAYNLLFKEPYQVPHIESLSHLESQT